MEIMLQRAARGLSIRADSRHHIFMPNYAHLVMTNFVTSRKFLEKIETFVSERETISHRLTRWVAGAVTM